MGGGEFRDGFAVFEVVVGEVVGEEFFLGRSAEGSFFSGKLTNLDGSERAIKSGELIDVAALETGSPKNGSKGEGACGVGLDVDALIEFVPGDDGFEEVAIEIDF